MNTPTPRPEPSTPSEQGQDLIVAAVARDLERPARQIPRVPPLPRDIELLDVIERKGMEVWL